MLTFADDVVLPANIDGQGMCNVDKKNFSSLSAQNNSVELGPWKDLVLDFDIVTSWHWLKT